MESAESSTSDMESDSEPDTTARPRKALRRTLSHIAVTAPAFPRSAYEGWTPPLVPSNEATAISDLKAAFDDAYANADDVPEYTYFTLDDFSIYHPHHKRLSGEMVTLDKLTTRGGYDDFLFDGILSVGDKRHFVQGVRFPIMTVDGYGVPDVVSLRDHISIQSLRAQANDVWYQLGKPSKVYERFYRPFLWLAQFTKYFADYLLERELVTLHHFRSEFSQWLHTTYGWSDDFQAWLDQCDRLTDFCTTVAAHYGYLWKECWSIDDPQSGLCKHPVWYEVDRNRLRAIPCQDDDPTGKTIVTPFVYNCFQRMYFHQHMEVREVSGSVLEKIAARKRALGLTPFGASQAPEAGVPTPQSLPQAEGDEAIDVTIGDVICVPPETDGAWRVTSSTWFAYVQDVRRETWRTLLDVIWLYEPHDTTLGNVNYIFRNELFMSDNCGCGRDAVNLDRVIGKAEVAWFAKDPSAHSGLFVRQKYRTILEEDTCDFVSLQESDFQCKCSKKVPIFEECRRKYQIGDTVLVRHWNPELREDSLEPSQIIDFDLNAQRVILQRFERRDRLDSKAPPNELLLPEERLSKPPSAVIRKCHIRRFTSQRVRQGLPTPYDRRGAGDFFWILDDEEENHDSVAAETDDVRSAHMDFANLTSHPSNTRQPRPEEDLDSMASGAFRLRGLGMFCGGGNFDRGLEDGGGVEFQYAIDWNSQAIHSYRANVDDPSKVHFYLGSVNSYLAKAMAGSSCKHIAGIGDLDAISAGSPCPGFSMMQLYKQSFQSLRNASMVASVVAYVDFYCPKYCILENVTSMTYGMGVNKDENVFAQILAAFVALGYQTQQVLMDAWNYASSQSRSRVFIVATAPGLEPLNHAQHTHAHPDDIITKSLGTASNGEKFGMRRKDYTPFQHVSPFLATADLPNLGDSQPQLCPAFPDHRTPTEEGAESRARIASVPVRPHGMTLVQAAVKGRLSAAPLKYYEGLNAIRKAPNSKTYSRIYPHGLFPTVTTALNLQCAFSGRTLHWSQDRSLTIMELKRAQGFLDNDVIIGAPSDKVRIIGNSVDRNMAFALGLSLKESWVNSKQDAIALCLADDEFTTPPSDESSHPAVALHPRPGLSNSSSSSNAEKQTWSHRVTLSQEETLQIRADPVHGFRAIEQIFRERQGDMLYGGDVVESSGAL